MTNIPKTAKEQIVRLGGRLRQVRRSQGLTKTAFARRLGISAAALSSMEQGRPGVSMGQWAQVLHQLNGPGELDRLLTGPGLRTPYTHRAHPRGLRQRTAWPLL